MLDDSEPRTWHHTYVIASASTIDKAIISSDVSALCHYYLLDMLRDSLLSTTSKVYINPSVVALKNPTCPLSLLPLVRTVTTFLLSLNKGRQPRITPLWLVSALEGLFCSRKPVLTLYTFLVCSAEILPLHHPVRSHLWWKPEQRPTSPSPSTTQPKSGIREWTPL